MSAVSKNVIPSASAASTTARVRSRSSRRPKLLQPSPTRETRRPLFPSSCSRIAAFWPKAVTRLSRVCGICGIASSNGPADPDRLARMSATLVHRGPDADGALIDGPVGLAARRLAIIDLRTGDQPIANEDGSIHVVQNGELYNYRELRAALERAGHRFRTQSDTEVLVHLYEEHGLDFARRLRGMFAVAVWDSQRRRLVLARDRYGIKPLYYRASEAALEFASELRALPRGEVDLDALEAFLAFNSIPAPLTIFREARKLPPGHVLVWQDGDIELQRFARPRPAASRELREDDEAELVEEPFADSSALPTYLVSQLAAQDVKVALSGEGGDELFGGYYTYAADLLALRVGPLVRATRPLVELLPTSGGRASFDYKAKRFARAAHLPPLERHHGWKEIFSADARAELTGRTSDFDPVELLRARFDETGGAELLARLQDVDFGLYLVDDLLVKTDRASMAHSLEARVPYLDAMVTNLAFALPRRHRVRGLRKKVLLRKAVAPLLPERIVRGKKRRFSIPAAAWLRGELEPFARDTLSPDTLRKQGYLRPEAVVRLIDRHIAGKEDLSRQLWGLLAFTLWHEHHVEREPGPLPRERLEALVR